MTHSCPMPELVYSIQELIARLCRTKTFGICCRCIYSHGWGAASPDVRACPADVFALDDCDLLFFAGKSPRSAGRARAAPRITRSNSSGCAFLST